MKLLFISTWFPYPPDNGSRIRAYNLIKALSRKHEVHLVSLLQEDSDPANASELDDICRVVSLHPARWFKPGTLKSLAGFLSTKPRSYLDTFDPSIRAAVVDAIAQVSPDAIVAAQLGAMVYVPPRVYVSPRPEPHYLRPELVEGRPAPVLFEEVEIGSMHRRLAAQAPLKRIRAALTFAKHCNLVKDLLRRADAFTCVSPGELGAVRRCCSPKMSGTVVPNGVDTHHFTPANHHPEDGALLYNGALTFGANLDAVRYFASEVYPILRVRRPEARLRVTGRVDGVDLTGIADCPGVELTGYVKDIREVLSRSAACIVPLRQGGGSRLKILEAMAAGAPVVSTSVGAEGLDVEPGRHLLIADTPEEFADAVTRVLTDPDLASRLSAEARDLVERRYDWSAIGGQLEERLALLVDSPARLLE